MQVRAETTYGNVTAQSTVVFDDTPDDQKQPPQISILAPLPGSYLAGAIEIPASLLFIAVLEQRNSQVVAVESFQAFDGLEFFAPVEKKSRTDVLIGTEYAGFSEATVSLEVVNRHIHDFESVMENQFDGAQEDEIQIQQPLQELFGAGYVLVAIAARPPANQFDHAKDAVGRVLLRGFPAIEGI